MFKRILMTTIALGIAVLLCSCATTETETTVRTERTLHEEVIVE